MQWGELYAGRTGTKSNGKSMAEILPERSCLERLPGRLAHAQNDGEGHACRCQKIKGRRQIVVAALDQIGSHQGGSAAEDSQGQIVTNGDGSTPDAGGKGFHHGHRNGTSVKGHQDGKT